MTVLNIPRIFFMAPTISSITIMYNYHPLSKEEPEIRVYEHIFEKSLKGIFTDRVDTASVLKLNDFEVIGFWLKWLFRFFFNT